MKQIKIICIAVLLFSCEKSEIPIQPHEMGDILSNQINMQSDYSKQVFYSLNNNIAIKENIKTDWDLGFESSEEGWRIILNTSTYSSVSKIINSNFEASISINNLTWQWENPTGIIEGTAIGDYRNENVIFIINRGYNINGNEAGYKKFMIESINDEYYIIKYANLDNTNSNTIEIQKDNSKNFQYLSFKNNTVINIEPYKEDWDLLFTQYTHLYNDPDLPPSYLVTGVLINYLNNVLVSKDSINTFEDINYNNVETYTFSNKQNVIGYDWKTYTGNGYIINTNLTYIIKDISNRYFKMRFIDFYNSYGEKGYPSFEIQEL